ncbi:Cysteine-rich DPF motif domain-containing protein 1 [Balamuthia mandrillaris]
MQRPDEGSGGRSLAQKVEEARGGGNATTRGSSLRFTCSICGMEYPYHHFGNKPPFCASIIYLEDCYVLKDPFDEEQGRQQEKALPICVGSHCSICQRAVCVQASCSLFYTHRFCTDCFDRHQQHFPPQLQKERSK